MKRAVAILVAGALVCLAIYLWWMNQDLVEFHLSPTRALPRAPLGLLTVVAFLLGVASVLTLVSLQAGRRALAAWRSGRRQRRDERIDDWEARGEALVWSGDTQDGRTLLQKAWRRRPESPHAVLALAASYRDTGELHRARGLLFDAANQHHTNPAVLFALADAYHAAGEPLPCIEVLERLRALHPRAPRVLRALRDRYTEADRWRDAATLHEALLSELRDPKQALQEREYLTVLRYQAALALPDAGARVPALEALSDGRTAPAPVAVSLGDALLANGHPDEASVVWERALRSSPRTVFLERLAGIATESRHRDRLRTLLRKLRADQIRADSVRLLTAQLWLADGSVDDAARELDAMQDTVNAPALLHHLWAEVHRRRGQQEQTIKALARAAGPATGYHCRSCRRSSKDWIGYCPQCRHWDTYRAMVEISVA